MIARLLIGSILLTMAAAAPAAAAARIDPGLARATARGGDAAALVVVKPARGSARTRARTLRARKRAVLRGVGRTGDFPALPVVGARVDRGDLRRLARHPLVVAVEAPRTGRAAQTPEPPADGGPAPQPEPGADAPPPAQEEPAVPQPEQPQPEQPQSEQQRVPSGGAVVPGQTGRGAEIMIADTGADLRRPAFGSCPRPGVETCRIVASLELAGRDGRADDDPAAHGTHVAAVVARAAPEAGIVVADVFRRTPYGLEWTTEALLRAIDVAVRRRDSGRDLAAINLSLVETGAIDGECSAGALGAALAAARRAGIVVVAAAGNGAQATGAFRRGLASPSCHRDVLSVGALHDGVEEAGCDARIACFSQSGRGLDLLAPGVGIESGGRRLSGTSQAAPLISAAVAALTAAVRLADPEDVRAALLASGEPIEDGRSGVTARALDGAGALTALRRAVGVTEPAPAPPAPPAAPAPAPRPSEPAPDAPAVSAPRVGLGGPAAPGGVPLAVTRPDAPGFTVELLVSVDGGAYARVDGEPVAEPGRVLRFAARAVAADGRPGPAAAAAPVTVDVLEPGDPRLRSAGDTAWADVSAREAGATGSELLVDGQTVTASDRDGLLVAALQGGTHRVTVRGASGPIVLLR